MVTELFSNILGYNVSLSYLILILVKRKEKLFFNKWQKILPCLYSKHFLHIFPLSVLGLLCLSWESGRVICHVKPSLKSLLNPLSGRTHLALCEINSSPASTKKCVYVQGELNKHLTFWHKKRFCTFYKFY